MTNLNKSFTRKELESILNNIINETLGDIDINNVFDKTKGKPKITGIAGDVIEVSVLGYPSDNKSEPDIIVDGKEVEVKTTGIRKSKKKDGFEAKEPMTITAVSPKNIINEEFFNSKFWLKLERLLLVFYHYNSDITVPSWEYANFPVKGYSFVSPDDDEIEKLKNDWEIVRDFIRYIHREFVENPESQYPKISSDLRRRLMLIDTAPKYPNPPRFRLKRSTVNKIVQEALGKEYESLPEEYNSFEEFDKKLRQLTKQYKNLTVRKLLTELDIPIKLNKKNDVAKSITEQIIVQMFGSNEKKMKNIDLFSEVGIIGKSIAITHKKMRTEDTKFFTIDFSEIKDENLKFEDSQFYEYFSQNQFLFIVFQEQEGKNKLLDNKFIGFKRLSFTDEFINESVNKTWEEIRYLVNNNKLEESIIRKKDGKPRINKNGVIRKSINFPKSRDNEVFVRGTGSDSSNKPLYINGIDMYSQQVWVKGSAMVNMLEEIKFA